MSKSSELKSAITALKMHEPIRLSKSGMSLRAPKVPMNQPVGASDSGDPVSQGNAVTSDQNESPVEVRPEDRVRSMDCRESGDIAKAKVPANAEDLSTSEGMSAKIHRRSAPRSATQQDESVAMMDRHESKLSAGYTKVPNSILMEIVSGEYSRAEIQILLAVARMTISFNRPLAPLSKASLERLTGIQGRIVLESVSSLLEKKRVRKIQGDKLSPNQLGLIFEDIPGFGSGSKNGSGEKQPTDESASLTLGSGSTQGRGAGVPTIKDSRNYNSKSSSLDFSELPNELREYFGELKPARKRESEIQAFQELKQDYSTEEITECLDYLRKRGTPGDGSVCHSPIAYLARAMNEVRALVGDQKSKSVAKELAEREARARLTGEREREAREVEEWRKKEEAFQREFPTEIEQTRAISEISRRLPWKLSGEAARGFAINAWWSERDGNQL